MYLSQRPLISFEINAPFVLRFSSSTKEKTTERMGFLACLALVITLPLSLLLIYLFIAPRRSSLYNIAGPRVRSLFDNHLILVLEYVITIH